MLSSIDANAELASTLMNMVGMRLRNLLRPTDKASLSPMTVAWLSSCDNGQTAAVGASVQDTLALLMETLHRISAETNDQFIANELHSVLNSMAGVSQ